MIGRMDILDDGGALVDNKAAVLCWEATAQACFRFAQSVSAKRLRLTTRLAGATGEHSFFSSVLSTICGSNVVLLCRLIDSWIRDAGERAHPWPRKERWQ